MNIPKEKELIELLNNTEIVSSDTSGQHCIHFFNGKWYNDFLTSGIIGPKDNRPFFKILPKRLSKEIDENGIGRTYIQWPTKEEVYESIKSYFEFL